MGILTITDAFTQYTELIPISNKQTTTVAKALLDEWMLRHGFYEQVVSDHGGESVSDVIIRLNEIIKMRHHVISPYSPHVGGQIVRVHRTRESYLKIYYYNTLTEWINLIPSLRLALNTRIHKFDDLIYKLRKRGGRMETAHTNQIRDNLPPPIDRYTSANQNLAIATNRQKPVI